MGKTKYILKIGVGTMLKQRWAPRDNLGDHNIKHFSRRRVSFGELKSPTPEDVRLLCKLLVGQHEMLNR